MKILAVDMGSLYATAWHASAGDEVNDAAQLVVDRIRTMAGDYDRVAIACDSRTNWRRESFPGYKADRPEKPAGYFHQLDNATERLGSEGYLVMQAEGFEADDVLATIAKWGVGHGHEVDIHTADKDLLQCLADGVRVISYQGEVRDATWMAERMSGLLPAQMPCFLALTGDKSDALPGVDGCGPKRAAMLLSRFDTIDELYRVLREEVMSLHELPGVGPALTSALLDADRGNRDPDVFKVRELATTRTNAPVDCEQLLREQTPTKSEEFMSDNDTIPPAEDTAPSGPNPEVDCELVDSSEQPSETRALMAPAAPGWRHALEPRTINEAKKLAVNAFNSRLFSGYGSAEQVFIVLAAGREMGMQAMEALRSFHVIKGKPVLSAQAMMKMCLRNPDCQLFRVRMNECDATKAVVEVKRAEWDSSETYTWTIADAEAAQLAGKQGDMYSKYPRQMLINRCIAEAARFAFPDVCDGVYAPEDFGQYKGAA